MFDKKNDYQLLDNLIATVIKSSFYLLHMIYVRNYSLLERKSTYCTVVRITVGTNTLLSCIWIHTRFFFCRRSNTISKTIWPHYALLAYCTFILVGIFFRLLSRTGLALRFVVRITTKDTTVMTYFDCLHDFRAAIRFGFCYETRKR